MVINPAKTVNRFKKLPASFRASQGDLTTEGLLRTLVAFPTITDDLQANHAALTYVAKYLRQRGMYIQRFAPTEKRREALIASTHKDNHKTPTVLLAAHMDVVTGSEDMFTLQVNGNKYLGRGVYDMKFAIAAYLKVVDQLRDHLTDYDFAIMLTCDEETGEKYGNGVQQFVEHGYLPRVVCLPDGGRDWQLEASAKGLILYHLEAHGKSAHGSRPWEGDNALLKLSDAIHDLRHQFRNQGPETDTLNVSAIEGGELGLTKVPSYAKAQVEFRLNDTESKQRIQKLIATLCRDHGIEAKAAHYLPPVRTDLHNSYVSSFANAIREVVGVEVGTGVKSLGASDVRYFAAKGVPYVVFYPYGGGHHSVNEWLDVASLEQTTEVLRRYLEDVAHLSV